jgi:hypothetical protein
MLTPADLNAKNRACWSQDAFKESEHPRADNGEFGKITSENKGAYQEDPRRSPMPAIRALTDRFKSKVALEEYLHSSNVTTVKLSEMLNLMDKHKDKLTDSESRRVYLAVSKAYEERASGGRA